MGKEGGIENVLSQAAKGAFCHSDGKKSTQGNQVKGNAHGQGQSKDKARNESGKALEGVSFSKDFFC